MKLVNPVSPPFVANSIAGEYLSLRDLAAYASISVRTLRTYLTLDSSEALPCYRLGGKILVRRGEFNEWMAKYRTRGHPGLAKTLAELGVDRNAGLPYAA